MVVLDLILWPVLDLILWPVLDLILWLIICTKELLAANFVKRIVVVIWLFLFNV